MQTNNNNQGIEQAAILLLSMGEEAAANVLQQLDREQVRQLSIAMASIPAVKKDQAEGVFQRFFQDFKRESGISGASRSYLERTLNKALGQSLSQPLLDAIYGDSLKHNLQRLQWLEPAKLAELISGEHPQMQAVFLAYLEPDVATGLLAKLPQDNLDELLYRLANLKEIHPDMMQEVHVLLEKFLSQVGQQNSTLIDGTQKAGDIINRLQGDQSLKVMTGLKEIDPELVAQLESQMYNFSILVRQTEDTLERLVEEVDQDLLATALKGADEELLAKVFATMPKRAAQYLREAMEGKGRVRVSAVEEARNQLVQILRQLADAGEIELQLFSEPVVE
ncbi:FliG C-terminal domain-containing protein [Photobacterium sanguinicancri]|uniref:Flagellar motor switch protein FliG n=1 Tax=Photobacterium sanguinicancri TaxID=875932 RepID=A0AAW7Y928_9GAMM|nr:FliG C-terminal domain-containing protein [Photobacterium sanguinicancri]KXI22963.1 flagellar motor switch protein FliG [Photobacterium sanguinicancri]MDO6500171.1 FliG C-terminal domain-containing protein [Photobacterium sanguinicancri]MDO6543823.1 FliG C-terminal domain-containing protein [Photobacterium sanguinicancri]OZS44553.1 flagellar motor switch protein FliG [Photobacterium sanguinicancri]